MEDEGIAGISMLGPRFIGLFFLLIYFDYALGILVEARRRNGAPRGRGPRRAARRFRLFIYMARGLWWTVKAFSRLAQGLIPLIRLASAAAAPARGAIAPAPLLPSQLSTAQEELQSQGSTVEEALQSNLSTITIEEENQLRIEDELQFQHSTSEEEYHSATEEELQSQLSASEEDFQPQALATEEELQSAVEEDFQPQRIEIGEEILSAVEEELHSQQSAIEGCSEVVILQESFRLINIWNRGLLEQCLRNLMASFKRINHPIQLTGAHSPDGSSSPCHFEHTYGAASVNRNNNDRHHQFKSLFSLDQGGNVIDHTSLLQFGNMIHKQSGKSGYQQILYDVLKDNSHVLDSFLCDCLSSAGLSIDTWTCMDDSQFTYEAAKRCVMILKVTAALLCLMKSELDEVKCKPFRQELRDYYFKLCARRAIYNLIEAADSISKLKWSASDIYQMLVLYEAIHDVLVAFVHPNESDRIFQQMRDNFEGIFDKIRCFICTDLNGSPCPVTPVVHQVTLSLVDSIELFKNHHSIVEHICVGDVSLGHLLRNVIMYWAEELEKHSESYPEGIRYIFILNNLTRFSLEIQKLLQATMPMDESDRCRILELLRSLINEYILKYLEKCWGPVKSHVDLNSGRKPCLLSLKAFTAQFDALCNCQMTWVLETELKKTLREKIKEYITPSYDAFLIRMRKKAILRATLYCQKPKTTKEVKSIVNELFESQHTE